MPKLPKIWKLAFDNIKKETFLSVSNVLVMTITFLILGVFITITVLTQTALHSLEQQAQITAFFKDNFTEVGILALKDQYEKDARIQSISYVSKEEAFRLFSEINKDEPVLLESISANVLPASLEIKAENIKDLSQLSEEFSKLEGVEDVRYFKDVIERFRFWSTVFYFVGFVLLVAFVLISYSVIFATLKSTINSRGIEISILKLVGATDAYIKDPFIYQGLMFGLFSSFIASLFFLILAIIFSGIGVLPSVSLGFIYGATIHPIVFAIELMILLMLSGAGLGYVGSLIAVKKYLKY